MPSPIDTAKVAKRRQLHFDSIDDILADVEGLASCKEIRPLGNWPADQVLSHIATVMNKSIDGFTSRPPWIVRFLIRTFMRTRFLTKPMSAGFKLPAAAQTELVPPPMTLEAALICIRTAIGRLHTESTRVAHPVLGELSADEWVQVHCRHSELHLSFLVPVNG